jgi:mannitol/fructose-specific phosphotransferase system IIA component (Ntr-type)
MKALLEFAYPEDEHKLQHAMRATEYYDALCDIDNILAMPHTKAEAYTKIRAVILEVLGEV